MIKNLALSVPLMLALPVATIAASSLQQEHLRQELQLQQQRQLEQLMHPELQPPLQQLHCSYSYFNSNRCCSTHHPRRSSSTSGISCSRNSCNCSSDK